MITPKPAPAPDETLDARLLTLVKTLSARNHPHLSRMLQFDDRHQKNWFREHRFTLLVTWLALQELLQKPQTPKKLTAVIGEWVTASEKLDMQAFLSGYEMGELLRERK